MEKCNAALIEKIREFRKENNISADELIFAAKRDMRDEEAAKIRQKVNEHRSLEGRCFVGYTLGFETNQGLFPQMKRYYKVISIRSESPFSVECLVCDEKPTYVFDYSSSPAGRPGDYFLGTFDFEGIHTKSILAETLSFMHEITTEEFNEAVRKYTDELLAMPWLNEHYRYGGKFPTDPGWDKQN